MTSRLRKVSLFFFFCCGLFFLVSCSFSLDYADYEVVTSYSPAEKERKVVGVGESILSQRVSSYKSAVITDGTFSVGDGFFLPQITIPDQKMYEAYKLRNQRYFVADHVKKVNAETFSHGGIKLDSETEEAEYYVRFGPFERTYEVPKDIKWKLIKEKDPLGEASLQKISYLGRKGNKLQFSYLEQSNLDDKKIEEFLEYDSDDRVLKIKEAWIEVFEANDRQLEYQVLSYSSF